MTSALLLAAIVAAGSGDSPKKGKGKSNPSCPYVGVAQLDPKGKVSDLAGTSLPKDGSQVTAFDNEGKVGHLRVTGGGSDLRFSDSIPSRMKSMSLLRVLLVDKSLDKLQVAQPEEDLPAEVNAEAVQILLTDSKGPRAALILHTNNDDSSDTCDQIQAKVKGAWKMCWTNCATKSDDL